MQLYQRSVVQPVSVRSIRSKPPVLSVQKGRLHPSVRLVRSVPEIRKSVDPIHERRFDPPGGHWRVLPELIPVVAVRSAGGRFEVFRLFDLPFS